MLQNRTIQNESSKIVIQWPQKILLMLAIIFGLVYLLFTLTSIYYSPSIMPYLVTHAGVYIAPDIIVGVLFLFFCVLYLILFFVTRTSNITQRQFKNALLLSTIFIVVLLMSVPFLSVDLYAYVLRSQITNAYSVNPYEVSPGDLGYTSMITWPDEVIRYGPLNTLLNSGLQKISGFSLAAGVFVFRCANIIVLFACAFLLYRIAQRVVPQYARSAVLLFLWNPFVLIEGVQNAHNDLYVLLFILAALYCIVIKRYIVSIVMLTLGFLFKFSPALLLPLPFMLIGREALSVNKKIQKIGIGLGIIIVLLVVAYLPYGNFINNLTDVQSYSEVNQLTAPRQALKAIVEFVAPDSMAKRVTSYAYWIVFGICFVVILTRGKLRTDSSIIQKSFWILLVAFFLVDGKFNIWYLLWLFPLVLLFRDTRYHIIIIFLTFYGFYFI